MSRTDSIVTIETWLAEGPVAAPDRLMGQLPAQLARTRQGGIRGGLRFAWLAVSVAAAVVTVAVLLSTVLAPEVGEDSPVDIPSPPAAFEEGDRVDLVLLISNLSDRPHGSWHWTGSSGSVPTAMPCHAVVAQHKVLAPGVVRFGEVDPETEEAPDRESLPVILDTASLPGQPVAYRDDVTPVWTYAYRISVTEDGEVAVEPLEAVPSLDSAGPLCPVPDTSWPDGWPAVQAWLADRPALPDCGTERVGATPGNETPVRNTDARQCLYDAWLAREDAQFTSLIFTDTGPSLEVTRTSNGGVEVVRQQLRSDVSEDVHSTTCWRLVRPSDSTAEGLGPADDATLVFLLEPDECSQRAEYWEDKKPKALQLAEIVIGLLRDVPPTSGELGRIELQPHARISLMGRSALAEPLDPMRRSYREDAPGSLVPHPDVLEFRGCDTDAEMANMLFFDVATYERGEG